MKKTECDRLTCKYNIKGIISESSRKILCSFCMNYSNFEEICEDDLMRLKPTNESEKLFPLNGRWDYNKICLWFKNRNNHIDQF